MGAPLHPDEEPPRVTPMATVRRGLRGRCGRCGRRGIFQGYFKLRPRCPGCGYQFEREEGFFTGVMLINLAVTEGLMFVGLMVWIGILAGTGRTDLMLEMFLTTLPFAIVVPVIAYPWAASTWAAMDLAMRPLEPDEEAAAITWLAAEGA